MEELTFLKDKLINLYNQNPKKVEKMDLEEMKKMCKEIEDRLLRENKNPNKFWIIKSMPEPKNWETKTTKKAGIWVFIIFILVFLIFGAMMFYLAFKNN